MGEFESDLGFDFPALIDSNGSGGQKDLNPKNCGDDKMVELTHNKLEMVLHRKEDGGFHSNETVGSSATSIGGSTNTTKGWRTLFPSAKPVTPQPTMKFTPSAKLNGKRVVDYAAGDFSAGIKRCEDYVIGFCVGKRLSFPAVKEAVTKHWKLKNDVSIKLHGNCAFIFEFKEDEDRRKVLELGSFYISGCLFTLRPWCNLIESSIASITTVPIWVLIYNVPLHMWDNEGLSLISSFLGKPLLADDYTLNRTRFSYARVCVEVDVDFSYPESIPLMIDGKIVLEMPVEYQWKPHKCDMCKVFGHSSKNCTKKLKSRWTTKKNGMNLEKPKSTAMENVASKIQGENLKDLDDRNTSDNGPQIDGKRQMSGMTETLDSQDSGGGSKVQNGSPKKIVSTSKPGKEASCSGNVSVPTVVKDIEQTTTHNLSAGIPIKTASIGPKAAVIGNGSNSMSAGVQATEKVQKHRPFHLSSDFPYQWKDLSKDKAATAKSPIQTAAIKNTVATTDDGNWNKISNRKSPVKKVVMDKKNTSNTKSSDPCVKVNNSFRVLSNENQQAIQDKDRVLIEECEEDNEDFYDVESDKYEHHLAYEDKNIKRIEKERSRLKWNGEIPNENLGKGQRSAIRKQK